MLLLARKNLLVHKGRFLLAVAGVACSVLLVLLLMGLYTGWRDNMAVYLRHVRADLWVGQKGAYDLFQTLSLLPAVGEHALRNVTGVEEVWPFVGRLMTCVVRGQQRHAFIVGVGGTDAGTGPVEVVAGRGDPRDGEIIIDQVFARKEGLSLGETLTVAGKELVVAGIARGGNCFLYQYAFVTLAQAGRLFGLDGVVNYFLVRLSPTASAGEVAARIEQASPLVAVFPKEQFVTNNLSLTGDNFLPILWVLEVIGILVGTVVIGLTIYTLTIERGPEYGVLKAVGAPDRTLYWTASLQAFACGLLGWLLGVPLSWGVVALAQYFVPQFPAASYPHHALWMLGCAVGMSLIAAVVPARRIARIDPLLAFKG
jgi:putative ABC transport system permease protein